MWKQLKSCFTLSAPCKPYPITPALSNKLANMALICSFLVVFIHTGTKCTNGDTTWWIFHLIKDGICRIAVPFFFVAAGFFLAGHTHESHWWRHECTKRIRTLLTPYLLWCLLFGIYSATLTLAANIYSHADLMRNFDLSPKGWLCYFGLVIDTYPHMVPLWFVRWLMVLIFIAPIFTCFTTKTQCRGAVTLLLLWCLYCYAPTGTEHTLWRVCSLEGIFYFALGLYLRYFSPQLRLPQWGNITLALLSILGFTTTLYGELHPFAYSLYPRMIAQLIFLYVIWQWLPSKKWWRWMTACAFPIFLLHMFILGFLEITKKNLPSLPYPAGITEYLLNGTIAILGSILVTLLLRKALPKIASILFGGR